MISHFGKAFWSFLTPSSVTCVLWTLSHSRLKTIHVLKPGVGDLCTVKVQVLESVQPFQLQFVNRYEWRFSRVLKCLARSVPPCESSRRV